MKEFLEKYLETILEIIIIILIIAILVIILFKAEEKNMEEDVSVNNDIAFIDESDNNAEENIETINNDKFYVDIKGAVKNPGVYEVNSDNIVNDVINLAGGLKSNASTKYLNLSKKVLNQMVIYVYTTSEVKNLNITSDKECVCDSVIIAECEGASAVVSDGASGSNNNSSSSDTLIDADSPKDGVSSKININTASLDELMTLNGIGESKAKAIIEYRNTNGNFKNIEELMNVSGIGEAAYQKIKDYITI